MKSVSFLTLAAVLLRMAPVVSHVAQHDCYDNSYNGLCKESRKALRNYECLTFERELVTIQRLPYSKAYDSGLRL